MSAVAGRGQTVSFPCCLERLEREKRESGSNRARCARSFTLVELMVVLAIIGMLAALLIFGVSSVRQKAMMVACQNNLREHGVYLTEYMVTKLAVQNTTDRAGFGGLSTVPTAGGGMRMYVGGGERIFREDGLKREYSLRDIDKWSGPSSLGVGDLGIGDYLDFDLPLEVRFCPAVDARPGYSPLADTNSPDFKGYGLDTWLDDAFWDGYKESVSNEYAVDSYILSTTYAFNTLSYHPDAVALIDWNAAEGWRGDLTNTTWQFNNPKKGIVRGAFKGTTNWWHTEVGFHHLGGACYATWGGRVGWVHSNDIDYSFFVP